MIKTTLDFDISHYLQEQAAEIEAWFRKQWQVNHPPIYGSMDIRNAGFKLAPVDTNLFPAGFNNLNPEGIPLYVQAMQATIAELCPQITRLLLIPESHTRNPFYFESLAILHEILIQSGFEVRIGSINPELTRSHEISLPSGKKIKISPVVRQGNRLTVEEFNPCCILLNNDLSSGVPEILIGIEQKIMPATQLGWSTRLKSSHFMHYQEVSQQFAEIIKLDPWLLTPYFDHCPTVDFQKQEGQDCLAERAKILFNKIRQKYKEYDVKEKPFLVVKADQGTYGMAVMMIDDPEQLQNLNHKQRQKMATIKGGAPVTKAIIQEGVHTLETVTVDGQSAVAEPVVYTIGRFVIGGFYRLHKKRGPRENLNSPGMNFEPLPLENYCHLTQPGSTKNRFYAYGVIARLALLAASRELDHHD